jgi:hypothetical protein
MSLDDDVAALASVSAIRCAKSNSFISIVCEYSIASLACPNR